MQVLPYRACHLVRKSGLLNSGKNVLEEESGGQLYGGKGAVSTVVRISLVLTVDLAKPEGASSPATPVEA